MAYTTPRTWVDGQLVTASQLNTDIRDNSDYLYDTSRFPTRNLLPNADGLVSDHGLRSCDTSNQNLVSTHIGWLLALSALGSWKIERSAGPSLGGLIRGAGTAQRLTCMTANTSPASGAFAVFGTWIPMATVSAVNPYWQSAGAKPLSLSFWVKSNVAGTNVVAIQNFGSTKQWAATYTVSSANTWERKTFVIPADVSGGPFFQQGANSGLRLLFPLAAGSDFQTGALATNWSSWSGTNKFTGQQNLAATANNTWELAFPQLEVGSDPTDFSVGPYEFEYQRATRNAWGLVGNAVKHGVWAQSTTTWSTDWIPFPEEQSTSPQSFDGTAVLWQIAPINGGANIIPTAVNMQANGRTYRYYGQVASGLTAGSMYAIENRNFGPAAQMCAWRAVSLV